ncbi:polysaccharide deacetylase family protein [Cellulosilyticum sp. WCF-2]|nr:polysaccharide deacetylase family protein [Cellulosilyticum sp. WCF-2]
MLNIKGGAMLINRLLKYKYIILLFFSLGIIGLIIRYTISLPPRNNEDTLEVMRLNQNVTPVFSLQPQLLYTTNLENQLIDTLESVAFDNEKEVTVQNINIAVDIKETALEAVANHLSTLSPYVSKLTVSLLASSSLDEQAYINLYEKLYTLLDQQALSKIEFILYPQNLSQLQQYNALELTYSIGININSLEDLNRLTSVYEHFKGLKKLYVREDFIGAYKDNTLEASKGINAFYYLLAIRYPQCTEIFSSFMKNPLGLENDFSLKPSNPNYTIYQSIYGRLLAEPWLTIKDVPLASVSPYTLLNSYDTLTGTEEILLSPESTFSPFSSGQVDTSSTLSYINYRLEEQEITMQNYYPYVVKIDTTMEPNGITRLKALGYNDAGEVIEVQSVDLTFQNENSISRAKRTLVDFPLSDQPEYGANYIPILMYHTVTDIVAKEENNSCVETKLFDAQMKTLIDNGYTPINFKVLYDYINGVSGLPEKPILITMDDGYLNNYTNAYPIYKKYNIPATLFVSPYFMEEENTERHFGWKAAKEMEDSGLIDIQSHGYNHTPLPYLSLKDVQYHISRSKGIIEKNLGPRDVFVVAYPQFRNTRYTRKLLSELGIDLQITKLAKRGTVLDASNLKRINVPNTMSPEELINTLEKLTN